MVPISRKIWALAYTLADLFLTPFFHVETVGKHFLPLKDGFILLPKHQCWQDIPLLGLAAGRPLYYVAKYELFRYPVIQRILRLLGGIPLNREKPLQTRWSFRAVVEVLQKGEGLVLFPEGTYFVKTMGNGRSGMLRYILNRIQVPLIPVGIQYRRKGQATQVSIRFGAPIKRSEDSSIMKKIMTDIAVLSAL
jgi:1-acyl-sn-glycerol-3-phosphate acyltransferase